MICRHEMVRARLQIVSLSYCRCASRCARRAFLYGDDRRYSGKNFHYPKPWPVARIAFLAEGFVIAAYVVMSNLYLVALTWTRPATSPRTET